MRLLYFVLMATILGGCAIQSPPLSRPVVYRCDEGREFSVSISPAGDTAIIDIDRMRFGLSAEPSSDPGEKFGCSALTFRRDGNTARVEMDGAQHFSNCHAKD